MTIQKYILGAKSPTFLFENLGKRCIRYTVSLIPVYQKYREGAPISNAPYKQHLGKIGDFDGAPISNSSKILGQKVLLIGAPPPVLCKVIKKKCYKLAIFDKNR